MNFIINIDLIIIFRYNKRSVSFIKYVVSMSKYTSHCFLLIQNIKIRNLKKQYYCFFILRKKVV